MDAIVPDGDGTLRTLDPVVAALDEVGVGAARIVEPADAVVARA